MRHTLMVRWLRLGLVMAALAVGPGSFGLPAWALDARTSIPGGMCSPWTTKQASSAMKEQMKVVREDPDYCVWYSKKPHNGNISTLSVSLWAGDPSSELPLLDQARGETWRNWSREDAVAGVPTLLTDVRRSGKNREISAAAFPDDVTWLDVNATSVIGADVRRAVKRMVEIAAPVFAAEAGTSPAASAPVPVETGAGPSGGPATACALLTMDEVTAALGEGTRLGIDVPEQCLYSTEDSQFQVVILTTRPDQTTSMLDRRKERSPDATPSEVGGYPALLEVGPLLGVPSVYVYPSADVELELELATTQGLDAQAVLLGLAEVAVGRLVELGLPVAPTPLPSLEPGTGLCSILSPDEASTALGGAAITNTVSDPESCAHAGDEQFVSVYLVILRGDQAASVHAGVSQAPDQFDLAGMPAVQMDPGANTGRAASMVYFVPDESTAAYVAVSAPEDVDVATTTRALAEIVAPRLRTYLGQ